MKMFFDFLTFFSFFFIFLCLYSNSNLHLGFLQDFRYGVSVFFFCRMSRKFFGLEKWDRILFQSLGLDFGCSQKISRPRSYLKSGPIKIELQIVQFFKIKITK